MLVSLMPLLLVKPLMGLGPSEWDLELRIVPERTLRKTGLMMGRQAKRLVPDMMLMGTTYKI
jgi:hypothetical protein